MFPCIGDEDHELIISSSRKTGSGFDPFDSFYRRLGETFVTR